jgi:hypothetical protein
MNDPNDLGKTILAALGGIKPTRFAPGGISDAKPVRRKMYRQGGKSESQFLADMLAQFGVSPDAIPPAAPPMMNSQAVPPMTPDAALAGQQAPSGQASGGQPQATEVTPEMLMGRRRG